MSKEAYIGLFRAAPLGGWHVSFPDLPGCEVEGDTFKEVFEASRWALAEHLGALAAPWPRPRSSAELLIEAQRDWALCRQFVDAVMHPVAPAQLDENLAPLDLVASQTQRSRNRPPHIGS